MSEIDAELRKEKEEIVEEYGSLAEFLKTLERETDGEDRVDFDYIREEFSKGGDSGE
jgi:hypothetical protein